MTWIRPNGTTDSSARIQAILDASYGARVMLAPGNYYLDAPIAIRRITGAGPQYGFVSASIIGARDGRTVFGQNSAVIHVRFGAGPAIVIHGGRGVVIDNVALVGLNDWGNYYNNGGEVWSDETKYVRPGVTTDPQDPYAAIAIDPYDTGTQIGSSQISIRNVYIDGFEVGIAVGCSGDVAEANGDLVAIADTTVVNCVAAFAYGQHETRGCTIRSCGASFVRTTIDCLGYGRGNGSPPAVFGLQVSGCKEIVRTYSSGNGSSFFGIDAESVMSIGTVQGGGARDAVTFSGCSFRFESMVGYNEQYRLVNSANTTFLASQIGIVTAEPAWIYALGGSLSFDGCTIGNAAPTNETPPFMIDPSLNARVSYRNCTVRQADASEGLAVRGDVVVAPNLPLVDRMAMPPGVSVLETVPVYTTGLRRASKDGVRQISIGTVAVTFGGDGTATFTPASVKNLRVGDTIKTITGGARPIGVIHSIVAGVVTLWSVLGEVADGGNGNHALYLVRIPRLHYPTTGDIIDSGGGNYNQITNLAVPGGWPAWYSSWTVGSRVRARSSGTLCFSTAKEGLYITAVSTAGAGLITLSDSATGTFTGASIFDAEIYEEVVNAL